MKRWYTYLWKDPKDKTSRYVGKGQGSRCWESLIDDCGSQTSNMLRKRRREGYICIPHIIWVNSESEALELEILLIAEIGRLDLGKGTLFNRTDGGEGMSGYVHKRKTCEHCGNNVHLGAFTRYHGDNCKVIKPRGIPFNVQRERYTARRKLKIAAIPVEERRAIWRAKYARQVKAKHNREIDPCKSFVRPL